MNKPFLFVGLDYQNPTDVVDFAEELTVVDRDNFGFKLNLDFFINTALIGNTQYLERIFEIGKPIFADLKMWNGRRTMTSIAERLVERNVDYFNVYALADKDFLNSVVGATSGSDTRVLGVTVLTHYDEDYCQRMRGCSLREAVRKDAKTAYSAGCHGIVLPGTMLGEVRNLKMEKLVPAIRPDWYGKTGANFQEQETSVREAIEWGADLLVCSSPIRNSENRREALIKTLDEMG